MLTSKQLRQKFLDYFKDQDHAILPSAPLVPKEDPTVLFNTAGMQPLVPFLTGQAEHPEGRRLANSQKCIRTDDIEEVGDNRHLTFFEMLGFWSIEDYFKKDAINWIYDFFTNPKWLGLDPDRIYITVYKGSPDDSVGSDEEAVLEWQKTLDGRGIYVDTGVEYDFKKHQTSIAQNSSGGGSNTNSQDISVLDQKNSAKNGSGKETKYLIFDFDGVLCDSFESCIQTYMYNRGIDDGARDQVISVLKNERWAKPRYSKENISEEKYLKIIEEKKQEDILKEKFGSRYFEDLPKAVKSLKSKFDLKMALVSTTHPDTLNTFTTWAKAHYGLEFEFVHGFGVGFDKAKLIEEIMASWKVDQNEPNLYFFTDTIRDVLEVEKVIPKEKIFGTSWGYHGREFLAQVLPAEQILENQEDIKNMFIKDELDILQADIISILESLAV